MGSHVFLVDSYYEVLVYLMIMCKCIYSFLSCTQELKSRIDMALCIVSNCFRKISDYHLMDETTTRQLLNDLKPLLISDHTSISYLAQGCLLQMGPLLFGQDREVLVLDYPKMNDLINGLKKAVNAEEQNTILSCKICVSTTELLNQLEDATQMEQNIFLMLHNSILDVLLSFIANVKSEIVKLSLNLVWAILVHKEVKKKNDVLKKLSDFVMTVKSLLPTDYYHFLFSAFYADLNTSKLLSTIDVIYM